MNDPTLPLPGLSPVVGKQVVARFDSGLMSSDAGVLVLREIEQRLRIAEQIAGCLDDPRSQAQVVHGLTSMIRFRMLMIASGYEDGNDASALRSDPAFNWRKALCLPVRTLPRNQQFHAWKICLMFVLYCAWGGHSSTSFAPPAPECRNGSCSIPAFAGTSLDDTFDAVHGGQQLRLFNGHYDEYGFQPGSERLS
jgi:hypothetical protein